MVRYKFMIPWLDDILDIMATLKIDLKSGNHQVSVRPKDGQKTTCMTKDNFNERLVMLSSFSDCTGLQPRVNL